MLAPVRPPKTGSSMHLFQTSRGVGSFVSKKNVRPETTDRSEVSDRRAKLAKDVGPICVLSRQGLRHKHLLVQRNSRKAGRKSAFKRWEDIPGTYGEYLKVCSRSRSRDLPVWSHGFRLRGQPLCGAEDIELDPIALAAGQGGVLLEVSHRIVPDLGFIGPYLHQARRLVLVTVFWYILSLLAQSLGSSLTFTPVDIGMGRFINHMDDTVIMVTSMGSVHRLKRAAFEEIV